MASSKSHVTELYLLIECSVSNQALLFMLNYMATTCYLLSEHQVLPRSH